MVKKLEDVQKPCFHYGHNPPTHMYYAPGSYEHICPGCGSKIIFNVPFISC